MAHLMLVNPAKRKKRKSVAKRSRVVRRKRAAVGYAKNPVRARKYRRNPISGGMIGQVKSAGIGAAGALAVDILMQKLPIPLSMRTGPLKHVAQGIVSLGLGFLVAKVGKNRSIGTQLADGGLVIAMYGGMKSLIGPKLGLSDDLLGDDLLGVEDYMDEMNGYDMSGYDMSGSTDDDMDYGVEGGWLSPAPVSSY
jgi:hypothetical protein